jgi:hypothetical protein
MDDLDGVLVDDAVEDLVTIAAHYLHSNVWIIGALRGVRLFDNEVYTRIDRTQDTECAARTSLFEIATDLVDVTERLRSIPNSHTTPRRFQNASTSSSEANGPRRALAIAARSSSLKT